MAKKRIIGFADEESFRRVREATRRVRSTPRVGAQRRRQPPIISPRPSDPDSGIGFGPSPHCPAQCEEEGPIVDCTNCDEAFHAYRVDFGSGPTCCEGNLKGIHVLQHDESCTWKSELIDGCEGEADRQWVLTVGDGPDNTTLTLELEEGTITYRTERTFCCLCTNELVLDSCVPHDCGTWPRRVCVQKSTVLGEGCGGCGTSPIAQFWRVGIAGVTDGSCTQGRCPNFNGSWILSPDASGCEFVGSCITVDDINTAAPCSGTFSHPVARMRHNADLNVWRLLLGGPVSGFCDGFSIRGSFAFYHRATSQFDCMGPNTMILQTGLTPDKCANWPATLDVVPIL